MKHLHRKYILILLLMLPVLASGQHYDTIIINNDVQLIHLKDSFFVHVTTDYVEGFGMVSSNGLIVIRNGNALMIDTPMDEIKTSAILDYLRDSMHTTVTVFIPGHWHNDCIGGLAELHCRNVFSIANEMTRAECIKRNLETPKASFSKSLTWSFCGIPVECWYPGAGHSLDNIVVYFPKQKILFGGCLIKSAESSTIGNIADANVHAWPKTLKKVQNKYRDAEIIISGHGSVGSFQIIKHTNRIVQDFLKKQ
ncbi:MAG: subclass B1 metallo-beta-lactamase [Bacteroidales bacterium]